MHASIPTAAPAQPSGTNSPTVNVAPASAALCSASLMNRIGRVLQDLNAGRAVTDSEIRQHALDCAWLMELAYARFQAGDPHARDEAVRWMHERDNALRALSPAWKAAREAQIQQAIAQGTGCYFMDEADRARARRAAGA